MNKFPLSPSLRATSTVVRTLGGAISTIIGISSIAYLIGWREARSYYSAFGAPWVTSLLSPIRLSQFSIWVLGVTIAFAFASIYSMAATNATHRGMRRWSIITLIIGVSIEAIDMLWPEIIPNLEYAPLMLGFAAVLFAISAGLTIAEIVARFKENNFRWHSYHLWLLYFVVILMFQWAPSKMGEARARLNMLKETSSLPLVDLKEDNTNCEWRLFEILDGNAILVSLGTSPEQNQFRITESAKLQNIRSTHRLPK